MLACLSLMLPAWANAQPVTSDQTRQSPTIDSLLEVSRLFLQRSYRADTSGMRSLAATVRPVTEALELQRSFKRLFRDSLGVVALKGANFREIDLGKAVLAIGLRSKALPQQCRGTPGSDVLIFEFRRVRGLWKISSIYVEFC